MRVAKVLFFIMGMFVGETMLVSAQKKPSFDQELTAYKAECQQAADMFNLTCHNFAPGDGDLVIEKYFEKLDAIRARYSQCLFYVSQPWLDKRNLREDIQDPAAAKKMNKASNWQAATSSACDFLQAHFPSDVKLSEVGTRK